MRIAWALIFLSLLLAHTAVAASLTVTLPDGVAAKSAKALTASSQPGQDGIGADGAIQGRQITFDSLKSKTPYDLKITLDNGLILHGVNLAWYSREPADAAAGEITDDDRRQITALVGDVKSFYNISRTITLSGDHQRATVLVERIRDTSFHSGAAGEVIWRVELWYFVNDFGGWNERPQTNKVLRRERFATHTEYDQATALLRWLPALGGITLDDAGPAREIVLPADALPATRPNP